MCDGELELGVNVEAAACSGAGLGIEFTAGSVEFQAFSWRDELMIALGFRDRSPQHGVPWP